MKRLLLSVLAVGVVAACAVPASAGEIAFSGQYRLRGEYMNNVDFDSNANDHTDFWGQRVRFTANAKATDDTSVKITLQDTRIWGATQAAAGGPGLTDTGGAAVTAGSATPASNTVDLHESYLNVDNLFGAPVTFRAGRQELVYGDERLVGAFGWNNNGRSFDALKFIVNTEPATIDVFTSKIVERTTTARDQDFYGIYATVKAIPNNTLDLYVLALKDGNQSTASPFGFGATLGNTAISGVTNKTQNLYTYGARLKGAAVGVDYTLEVPFQTGKVQTTTNNYKIQAKAYAVKAGYTLPMPAKVRVGAEYDYASGDKDGTDEKIKTFFNLFPTNHDKLGYADMQAWRNVKAWNLNVSAEPLEKLKLYAAFWSFNRAVKEDSWYAASNWNNSPAAGLRTGAGMSSAPSSNVGNEIDLVATYKYNTALTAELGLSRFSPGKAVKDYFDSTAASEDKTGMDFAYLQLTANF